MKKLFTFFAFLAFGWIAGNGCTLGIKGLDTFDHSEYVFIGTVTGYTKQVRFDTDRASRSVDSISATRVAERPRPTTFGLIVKLKEAVYLPRTSNGVFELYPYDLWADCSVGGISLSSLSDKYPIGTEIRVIAKEAKFIEPSGNGDVIQLERRPDELGSIAINSRSNGNAMTSATSLFDYKSFKYDLKRDSDSTYLLPSFEARKDLLRLSQTKDQKEKDLILERLRYAPDSADVELHGVFTDNNREEEYNRFYEAQLKASDPEFYKQYMVINSVRTELLKQGFNRKSAEDAIGKAMEVGTEFDFKKLLDACLKILKPVNTN